MKEQEICSNFPYVLMRVELDDVGRMFVIRKGFSTISRWGDILLALEAYNTLTQQ